MPRGPSKRLGKVFKEMVGPELYAEFNKKTTEEQKNIMLSALSTLVTPKPPVAQ